MLIYEKPRWTNVFQGVTYSNDFLRERLGFTNDRRSTNSKFYDRILSDTAAISAYI